jgi:hypothetical protein
MEFGRATPFYFNLPMPEGGEEQFRVEESPMISEDFAQAFPAIKTYAVQAVSNPVVQGRLTLTPNGFFAAIIVEGKGMMMIRPLDLNNPLLHEVVYDEAGLAGLSCGFDEIEQYFEPMEIDESSRNSTSNGATRRTYDMAIVTTGEFHDANGATVPAATAVVTATMSAIQAIFDRELAVRFNVLTPVIFTNFNTDPFDPASGLSRTQMAAQAVAANFPIGNYDIGHVFHDQDQAPAVHAGGGVAGLGVVCENASFAGVSGTGPLKAAGWSGSFSNTGNSWIRLATHEIGHQFNMQHTFNGNGGSCNGPTVNPNPPPPCFGGNLSVTTAYEIGSGTTIMSYNGICGASQNIPSGGVADNYFHINSLEAAAAYIAGETCHTAAATGNTPPVVNANPCGGAYTIPKSTPFTLTGSATDADGDQVYYSWEQYDEDGFSNDNNLCNDAPTHGFIGATAGASPIAPLFRSYPPTTSPSRTFPNISLVAANSYSSDFEPLPSVARTLNFRLTGRDFNANGGGIHCQALALTVSAQGPLAVTAPNGGGSLAAGSNTNVTWNLNGITFLTNVNIKLSIDGGLTYPYILAANTPAADGIENVTIPAGVPNVTTARIRVESADNTCVVFFDISNSNFTITSNCNAPSTEISPTTAVNLPAGDPGLNLGLTNNLGSIVTNFAGSITSGDAAGNLVFLNGTPAACATAGNATNYDVYTFSPDVTGSYTFTHTGPFGLVLNLYAAPFTGTNCSNHLGSSATRPSGSGPISLSSSVAANLTAGTLYVLMVSNFGAGTPALPAAYTINFTKPGGSNIYNGVILPAGYAYTYVAVNNTNGVIQAVSASSNFTSLAAGTYTVYGVAYKSSGATPPNNINPATWVGQALGAVLSSGDCMVPSSNSRPVTVTGGACPPTLAVNGNPIANGTYLADMDITSSGTVPNGGNVVFGANTTIELQANFEVVLGGVFEIMTTGCMP